MTSRVAKLIGAGALFGVLSLASTVSTAGAAGLTAYTGSPGGLYMEPFIVWSEQWRGAGIIASVINGGSSSNPLVVRKAEPGTAMGVTTTILASDAWKGTGEYAKDAPGGMKELRALWRFNVTTYAAFMFHGKSLPDGVKTIGDVIAKSPKISIDLKERGSGAESAARAVFESYGLTYKDLAKKGIKVSFSAPADASALMVDGHLDGMFGVERVPAASTLDMDSSIADLVWIGIDQKNLEWMRDKYGYIIVDHRGPTTYKTFKKSFKTAAYDHVVFVHKNMDEETAYQLTMAVMKDPDQVRQAVPAMKTFDPKVAFEDTQFPLHPGAVRAYKELGLMK